MSTQKTNEAELRKAVVRAIRKVVRSLEHEPTVIIDCYGNEDIPDSAIGDIEEWLFNRRQKDGDKNDELK